jgi:hypothetical protein
MGIEQHAGILTTTFKTCAMCSWFHCIFPIVFRIPPRCCSNAISRPFSTEEERRKAGRCVPPSVVSPVCVSCPPVPPSNNMGVQATWRAHPRKFGPDSRAWSES